MSVFVLSVKINFLHRNLLEAVKKEREEEGGRMVD